MNKYIYTYNQHKSINEDLQSSVKKLGSKVKEFVSKKLTINSIIRLYQTALKKELMIYQKYANEITKLKLDRDTSKDKSFYKNQISNLTKKMSVEIDAIYIKIEPEYKEKLSSLSTIEIKSIETKISLMKNDLKIQKLKIDQQQYKKLGKPEMATKLAADIAEENRKMNDKSKKAKETEKLKSENTDKEKLKLQQEKLTLEYKNSIKKIDQQIKDTDKKDKKTLIELRIQRLELTQSYIQKIPKENRTKEEIERLISTKNQLDLYTQKLKSFDKEKSKDDEKSSKKKSDQSKDEDTSSKKKSDQSKK